MREVLAGFLASRPDRTAETVVGTSVDVLKRQPDGSWRYIIDHPWGGD